MKENRHALPCPSPHGILRYLLIIHFTVLLASITHYAAAQTSGVTVTGKISDASGSPVAGVSVMEKGTRRGTVSNADGTFSITVSNEKAVLRVSSVEYAAQEFPVNGNRVLNITLHNLNNELTQVVVVGYGTQRKKDVTGSVASVNLEAMKEAPNTNIGQFLQGTVPGLNVGLSTFAGGTPPISIRGQNTLNGNQNVLIILDGIQYTGNLSSINPDDIASIDVLKDASSTAVYGAQAANGVMLITTRRGRSNQVPRIALSSSFSTQRPTEGLRPKNLEEYLNGIRDAYYNQAYIGPDYTQPNPNFDVSKFVDATMRDASGQLLPNDFNWWDAGTNTGKIIENNLSISGGGDRFNYLLSGGLVDQKGFIINDKFKRKSIRANIETKALPWWKVGLISSGSFVNQDGAEPALGSLQHWSPLHTPFDANGKLIPFPTNTLEPNPFTTYYVEDRDRTNYYFANIYSDIDVPFIKGLNYRMNFGNNYRTTERFFASIYAANLTGEASKRFERYYDYTFDNILTYKKTFGKHDITATLLYGAVERKFDSTASRSTGFSRLTLGYNNLGLGTTQFASSNAWSEKLNYQMARVNYKLNEKYLVTATLRRDGFSGFAKNFKYGYFPVLALGWIVSEEDFMSKADWMNFLKLRAGYGVSGNQTTRYSSIPRVTTSAAYVFGDGSSTAFGQQVASLGNDDLKWERTKGLNVGVDFTILNNRLTGNLDFYRNNTTDLLYSVAIPTVTGFGNFTTNLGQMRNTGFEATLTYKVMEKKDFNWSATFNFWTNKNEIISLTGQDINKDGIEDDLISSGLFIGRPRNAIYDYQLDGIYQLTDPVLPGFFAGTVRIVDQNKDNQITPENDRIFQGRREPAYRFSLYNSFNYKAFSLSFFLNSIQGGKDGYLGNNNPMFYREDNTIRNNTLVQIDYWSPVNPNGKYPRNISGAHAKIEPNRWESRSFVRLQDVSLSYNLASLIKGKKVQALNVYVSGKNLITWTNWAGWDPEIVDDNGNAVGLVDGGRPVMRAFTVGINIIY